MSNRKSISLLKNTGILTISNFASKILSFLLVPLYTSVLSTKEYGTYDLAATMLSLIIPILTLNIGDALLRFLLDKNYDKEKVNKVGLKISLYSILIAVILLIVVRKIGIWDSINGLEKYVLLLYIFSVFYQYLIQFAKGMDSVKTLGIAGVISTIVMVVTNLLLLLVFKLGLKGYFIANILSQAIPAFYITIKTKFWKSFYINDSDKKLAKEMILYSLPLIATSIGWWVNSSSDRYVVTFFCGIAANGVLSVAYKIPTILGTLQGIFIQAWQISAIQEYDSNESANFYGNVFEIINLLMCAACSCLILLTKPLAHLLYAKDFYAAWEFVPFLLLSSVFNCVSGLIGAILSAKKDTKTASFSVIIGAAINLILNIILVKYIGVQGVTIATAVSSLLVFMIRMIMSKGNLKIKAYLIIYITWILLCVQAIIEVYFENIIFEVVIMLILIVINLKKIQTIVKKGYELIISLKK